MCQNFQHDRSAPGNLCDCGHSACYHSQTPDAGKASAERSLSALKDQVEGLEDIIRKEISMRDDWLVSHRDRYEQEVQLLKEALSTAHRNGIETKKALLTVENKLERCRKEHVELTARVEATDNVGTTLEKRMVSIEAATTRKRKASHSPDRADVFSPKSVDTSSHSDTPPASDTRSPQGSPPVHTSVNVEVSRGEPQSNSPRSGGVIARSSVDSQLETRRAEDHAEPRSSGFLSISLTERLRHQRSARPHATARTPSLTAECSNSPRLKTAPRLTTGTLSLPAFSCSDSGLSMKQSKRHRNLMALDILANATVARPLMHGL